MNHLIYYRYIFWYLPFVSIIWGFTCRWKIST